MADSITKPILSVCATTSSKVKDLVIKDGQLIFVNDNNKIALDFGGKRTFYNQITELESEQARTSLLAPITGHYYFVIETSVLWTFQGGWKQLTTPPEEIVFIGTELPELGVTKTLYISKEINNEHISVWDDTTSSYVIVADKTQVISEEEISSLFLI